MVGGGGSTFFLRFGIVSSKSCTHSAGGSMSKCYDPFWVCKHVNSKRSLWFSFLLMEKQDATLICSWFITLRVACVCVWPVSRCAWLYWSTSTSLFNFQRVNGGNILPLPLSRRFGQLEKRAFLKENQHRSNQKVTQFAGASRQPLPRSIRRNYNSSSGWTWGIWF